MVCSNPSSTAPFGENYERQPAPSLGLSRGGAVEPLADYSGKDAAAPPDLFSDLFAAAGEFLSPHPTDTELEEARNNPDKARERFLVLKGTDFANESAIVHFLEEAQDVITV